MGATRIRILMILGIGLTLLLNTGSTMVDESASRIQRRGACYRVEVLQPEAYVGAQWRPIAYRLRDPWRVSWEGAWLDRCLEKETPSRWVLRTHRGATSERAMKG